MIPRCWLPLLRRKGSQSLLSHIAQQEWQSPKKNKNSGRGSHKGPRAPNAVAGQQSIVSAFQKQSAMPTIHTPNTSTAQMQKECTTSPVNVENSRCCSKGCGQRLESWGRGPDSVKFCHFCGRRCHVRCVAKSQHECDTEHFNAKWEVVVEKTLVFHIYTLWTNAQFFMYKYLTQLATHPIF